MDHEPEVLRVGEEGYGFHKDKVIHLHNEPFPDSYYGCGKVSGMCSWKRKGSTMYRVLWVVVVRFLAKHCCDTTA